MKGSNPIIPPGAQFDGARPSPIKLGTRWDNWITTFHCHTLLCCVKPFWASSFMWRPTRRHALIMEQWERVKPNVLNLPTTCEYHTRCLVCPEDFWRSIALHRLHPFRHGGSELVSSMLVAVEHVKTGTSRRQQHDISWGSIPPCFSYGFYQIRC